MLFQFVTAPREKRKPQLSDQKAGKAETVFTNIFDKTLLYTRPEPDLRHTSHWLPESLLEPIAFAAS